MRGGASPVPVAMWQRVSPVPVQTWQGVSPVPVQTWQGVSPGPGAGFSGRTALDRSVSCARIVDAVRVFSAGRIFSQNLQPTVVSYPGYPLSAPEYPAAAAGQMLEVPVQVWAG